MLVENRVDQIDLADEFVQRLDRLHSAPKVAQQVLQITRDPRSNIDDLVRCIEHDPGLAAKILQVVNSARYGVSRKITSIKHAVSYLGKETIRMLTISFSMVESLSKGSKGRIFVDYWQNALTIASISSHLASHHKCLKKDEAYTAGLLADVGILVFSQVDRDEYSLIYESHPHGEALINGEQQFFGFDHALLGSRLLNHWDIPQEIVTAVENHHGTGQHACPLGIALRTGSLLAGSLWNCSSDEYLEAEEILISFFDLSVEQIETMIEACKQDIAESADFFGVNLEG
ncbi:MAG: HDOD domain-containing protein [Planctomycetes bacterium]|nr:HDOD domain-containing protein [Planctomycetota bacterium]MCH9727593.1 HDOD domain-containing protein [Planctomycetota bacterium]MCH9777427.1 HDOD domain-containing protein [Planctomycetota bacterium]MCH9792288.1 HDOD domain-containing protein [Planctomycetota bacterium]